MKLRGDWGWPLFPSHTGKEEVLWHWTGEPRAAAEAADWEDGTGSLAAPAGGGQAHSLRAGTGPCEIHGAAEADEEGGKCGRMEESWSPASVSSRKASTFLHSRSWGGSSWCFSRKLLLFLWYICFFFPEVLLFSNIRLGFSWPKLSADKSPLPLQRSRMRLKRCHGNSAKRAWRWRWMTLPKKSKLW